MTTSSFGSLADRIERNRVLSGNAMTFTAECARDRRRGFLGSWLELGTFTGYLN